MLVRTLLHVLVTGILLGAPQAFAHEEEGDAHGVPYEGPGYRGEGGGVVPLNFSSRGVVLLSWLSFADFGAGIHHVTDCWGYTAPSGREYAMIAFGAGGTGFVEVTDPDDPTIVDVHPGIGVDLKTHGHYAYVVSEGAALICEGDLTGGGGIQVFDLSQIDSGVVSLVNTVTTGGRSRTHNLAINQASGFLYRLGGTLDTLEMADLETPFRGLRIYELADPTTPTLVGEWHDREVHDAQVVTYTSGPFAGREIAFCFTNVLRFTNCGNFRWIEPGIDIIDVTDKSNIVAVSFLEYSRAAFSHQGWLSPDRRYLYVGDEFDEAQHNIPTTTRIIDVSDIAQPVEVGTFTNGVQTRDHNLYTRDDLIFEANYRSGLRVFDATDALAPVEVAYFDTHPETTNRNFAGLWSVYPFFESGVVIGSDTERGLFVWWVGEPQLGFEYTAGQPRILNPTGQSLRVEILENGTGVFVPGSAKLQYGIRGDSFEVDLVDLGAGTFEAMFPGLTPGALVSYHVAADTVEPQITWRDPPQSEVTARVPFPDECGPVGPCEPWLHDDVGETGIPGGLRSLEGLEVCLGIVAAEGNITGRADGFHYAYQQQSGNFRLTAQITEWDAETNRSKLGLLVRESLEPGARSGGVVLDLSSGRFRERFLKRATTGGSIALETVGTIEDPLTWLRVERIGNSISGSFSADGNVWSDPKMVELEGLADELVVGIGSSCTGGSTAGTWCSGTVCNIVLEELRPHFLRGDCNGDGKFDISDGVANLNSLFGDAKPSNCTEACNANDDAQNDVSDAVYVFNFLFGEGSPPAAPYPACDEDPEPAGSLGCGRFACE